MALSKEVEKLWKKRLEDGCLGLAGIHDKNGRQGTFINILRFIDGGKMPSDKHMMHQGHLVPNMFMQEFMKINADAEGIDIENAPTEIIDSIITSGKWYNYICDKFVHIVWRLNQERIRGGVAQWDTIKGILDIPHQGAKVEKVTTPGN